MIKLPRQIALVLSTFPVETWAQQLVNNLNQFSLEVVQALRLAVPQYRTLNFTTGASVPDSFPVDFPVDETPNDVWVASSGVEGVTNAIAVNWAPILGNNSAPSVRISYITGLASLTRYSIRLGYR